MRCVIEGLHCTIFSVVEELEHDIFDPIETIQEEKTAAILKHMPVRERWDSQMSWKAEVSIKGTEVIKLFMLNSTEHREPSSSVIECLTRDRSASGSSLRGVTALWSLSKTHLC